MSKHLLLKFLLIAALAAVCLYEIFPVERQIRLGKDLRGGVSLTYSVRVPEGSPPDEVIAQVIDVPNGASSAAHHSHRNEQLPGD